MKKTIFIVLFTFALFLIPVFSIPDEFGRGYTHPFGNVSITNFREKNDILDFFENLFAVVGLKSSYKPGEKITISTSQSLKSTCAEGTYVLVLEVYNRDKTQQFRSSYAGGDSYYIGNKIELGKTYTATLNYIIPEVSFTNPYGYLITIDKGTWSISSYLYCVKDTRPASQYSSVDEINFNLETQTTTCTSTCIKGQKKCDTYGGYGNRYVNICDDYNKDGCYEWAQSLTYLIDCGGIDMCSNGACLPKKYKCSGTSCVLDPNGPYDRSDCYGKCQATTTTTTSQTTTTTNQTTTNPPRFEIINISAPSVVYEDEYPFNFKVTVKNTGGPGEKFVEAGFGEYETIKSWTSPLMAVFNIAPNCMKGQTWMQTQKVYLDAGETVTLNYTVRAPDVCVGLGELTKTEVRNWNIFAGAYVMCSNEERVNISVDRGVDPYKYVPITIKTKLGFGLCDDTCNNGYIDNGESGPDCGKVCKNISLNFPNGCPLEYPCKQNDDCASGYCRKLDDGSMFCDVKGIDETKNCPNPRETKTCIPAGCEFIDAEWTVLAGLIQSTSSHQTNCCPGSYKKITGYEEGPFKSSLLGIDIYKAKLTYGICESESERKFDMCSLDFIKPITKLDCTTNLIIEAVGLFIIFLVLIRR